MLLASSAKRSWFQALSKFRPAEVQHGGYCLCPETGQLLVHVRELIKWQQVVLTIEVQPKYSEIKVSGFFQLSPCTFPLVDLPISPFGPHSFYAEDWVSSGFLNPMH